MAPVRYTGAFALIALLLGACTAQTVEQLNAPLLAWSNSAFLAKDGLNSRAVYEVASTHQLTGHLVLGALGKQQDVEPVSIVSVDQSATDKAELVVVFLGNQVDASTLRRAARLPALQPLTELLGKAESSVVLPFLQSPQGTSLLDSLRSNLETYQLGVQAVGCFGDSQNLAQEVQSALSNIASLQVLLVCSSIKHSTDQEALSNEVQQLTAVSEAVQRTGKRVLFVYAGVPDNGLTGQKRSLLQTPPASGLTYKGFGQYTECGALCWTQVRWLEGMLAVLILAIVACSGMTCLYMLNTPTRFEVPKEGQANQ